MNQLRLYYPVRPYVRNQRFGDNLPCVKDFGLPTQRIVIGTDAATCPAGYEKLYPKFGMSGHNGEDLNAGVQPVRAAVSGYVVEIQDTPARGLGIGILTDDQYDFGPLGVHYAKLRYWHLKEYYVKAGDWVDVGQVIGLTDSTGYSSGNHLHFELNLMDKDVGGHPYQAFPNNGIAGAQDPGVYWTGMYADVYAPTVTAYQKLLLVLQALIAEYKKPH